MFKDKEKIVYAKWIADGLIKKGYTPLRVENNPKQANYLCWVFPNTAELNLAFSIVLNQNH